MEPMAARALLAISLSPGQREKLRRFERTLPPGRLLQGAEIVRMFGVLPPTPEEAETEKLKELAKEWERRILWKKNQIETKNHETVCAEKCKCRTRQQEIHEWEDWAMQNFDKPLDNIEWPAEEKVQSDKDILRSLGIRPKRVA